jgi:hypothetical protein
MAGIVVTRVETQSLAERMLGALVQAGFARERIACFYVNPPGAHALHPGGGDAVHDEGSKETGRGALRGAGAGAVIGVVAGAVLAAGSPIAPVAGIATGVVIAAAGAAVGAYTGSFLAGVNAARSGSPQRAGRAEPVSRKAGMLVAVAADDSPRRADALQVMRAQGGVEIELTQGTIRDGDWVDFEARLPPRVIGSDAARPASPRS